MNAETLSAHPIDRPVTARRVARATRPEPGQRPALRGDVAVCLLLLALVGAAWQISRLQLFRANDDSSYWIAVAGGSMMLALFSYPLRKHLRVMQRLGKVKWWFWLHLFFGIAGPWLILVHSTFRVGSLNAGVALYSMVIVVLSGVVGRFIYVRVHRGLDGERTGLAELRVRAGLVESEARSRLHFAPRVEEALLAFEQRELGAAPGLRTSLRRVAWLPLQKQLARSRCNAELKRQMRRLQREFDWSEDDLQRRFKRSRGFVTRYLDAVVRVAQFSAYERLFALWHVAHLPFVYLLVISAVVHVIAVHAY